MLLLDHINKNQKQKPKKNRLWIRPQKDLTLLGAQKKLTFMHTYLENSQQKADLNWRN